MLSMLMRFTTGTILLLALGGCPATPTASVASVTINGGDQTIVLGDNPTLTATVERTGDASTKVIWSSSNTDVATIDPDGQVTSLTTGDTHITATSTDDPTKNDRVTVTVHPPGLLTWTRQFGTSAFDDLQSIATDANGNTYAAGYTDGALEGANAGGIDAFIRSYDSDGNLRWTRQFGTGSNDYAYAIATNAIGDLYATGHTAGILEGANTGGFDAFVRSYDSDGNLRWTRQFGTGSFDRAYGVATDANGNLYAAGHTDGPLEGVNAGASDAFIRSYDSDGNLRWTRQFGTSTGEYALGIATDSHGNLYVTGITDGALEGTSAGSVDAFVRSYDSDGNLRWTRQFGSSSYDYANGVNTDANGNVYTAGSTRGNLEGTNAGGEDAFIRSYDSDGNLRWTRQFGTGNFDNVNGVAADARGNVYAAGYAIGVLEGAYAGGADAFIRSYDSDGTLRWTRQFGTSSSDVANAIVADASGDLYVAGRTAGAIVGTNAGGVDSFIRKYGP